MLPWFLLNLWSSAGRRGGVGWGKACRGSTCGLLLSTRRHGLACGRRPGPQHGVLDRCWGLAWSSRGSEAVCPSWFTHPAVTFLRNRGRQMRALLPALKRGAMHSHASWRCLSSSLRYQIGMFIIASPSLAARKTPSRHTQNQHGRDRAQRQPSAPPMPNSWIEPVKQQPFININ